MLKKIFISADHGMAIIYFLQSNVVPTLLDAGVEVVLLTDDEIKSQISSRFGRPGLTVEGLRLKEASKYASTYRPRLYLADPVAGCAIVHRRCGRRLKIASALTISLARPLVGQPVGQRPRHTHPAPRSPRPVC